MVYKNKQKERNKSAMYFTKSKFKALKRDQMLQKSNMAANYFI